MIWRFFISQYTFLLWKKSIFKKFHSHFFSINQQLHTECRKEKARVKVTSENPPREFLIPIPRKVKNHIDSRWPPNSYSKLFLPLLFHSYQIPTSSLRRLTNSLILTSESLSIQNQAQPHIFHSFITAIRQNSHPFHLNY